MNTYIKYLNNTRLISDSEQYDNVFNKLLKLNGMFHY